MALRLFTDNDYVDCDKCLHRAMIGDYGTRRDFSHGSRCNYLQSTIEISLCKTEIKETIGDIGLSYTNTWQQQQGRSCIECGKLPPPWKPKSAVCGPCRDKIKDYLFNTYYRGPGTWRLEDRKPEMAATACPLCDGPREITPDGNVVCRSRDCNKNLMFAEHYGAKAEDIFAVLRDVPPNVEDIYTTVIVAHEPGPTTKFGSIEDGWVDIAIHGTLRCQCGSEKAGSLRHSDWCPKYDPTK